MIAELKADPTVEVIVAKVGEPADDASIEELEEAQPDPPRGAVILSRVRRCSAALVHGRRPAIIPTRAPRPGGSVQRHGRCTIVERMNQLAFGLHRYNGAINIPPIEAMADLPDLRGYAAGPARYAIVRRARLPSTSSSRPSRSSISTITTPTRAWCSPPPPTRGAAATPGRPWRRPRRLLDRLQPHQLLRIHRHDHCDLWRGEGPARSRWTRAGAEARSRPWRALKSIGGPLRSGRRTWGRRRASRSSHDACAHPRQAFTGYQHIDRSCLPRAKAHGSQGKARSAGSLSSESDGAVSQPAQRAFPWLPWGHRNA